MTFGLFEAFQIVFNAIMLLTIAALLYGLVREIVFPYKTEKLRRKNRARKNAAKNTKKTKKN